MKLEDIKPRRRIPILPGMLTPSIVDSDIVLPEIGLQVGTNRKNNNLDTETSKIMEITDSASQAGTILEEHENLQPKGLKNRVITNQNFPEIAHALEPITNKNSINLKIQNLERQNANLARAIYSLSNRVSIVENCQSSFSGNNLGFANDGNLGPMGQLQRPNTNGMTTGNLMAAMKISNELITEIGDRLRRQERKMVEVPMKCARDAKVLICMLVSCKIRLVR